MRPFTVKTEIVAADKASKNINKINTAASRMAKNVTKESKIAGSAFSRFSSSIGLAVKKATVSLNNLNARINRVGRNIKKQLGTLGLAVGFTTLIIATGNTINKFAEFEQANANLSAVMATATDPELKALQIDAKRLGATTAKTSTQVVGLQESLARLGFGSSDVINMTESIISGSVAMQGELSSTAELVGAMVKSFDVFNSTDTPAIVDQMTVATQRSALSFEKLNTMLPTVAGAANAAGIPFNKMLALLGKLSDAGIDASSSSTALRNIILQSGKQGKNYEGILADIVSQQDKLTTSMNEFGVRAAVPATILAGKLNETLELSSEILNSQGASAIAASKQLDTFKGSLTILGSAWEGYILSIEDGKGAISGFLKDAVKMTTEILSIATGTEKAKDQMTEAELRIRGFAETGIKLLKVLRFILGAFIAFKIAVVALRAATFAYNVALGIQSALLGSASIAMKANTVATWVMNVATKAMAATNWIAKASFTGVIASVWAFNAALFTNPITWIVLGIVALIAGIVLLIKNFDKVKKAIVNVWKIVEKSPILKLLILPIYLTIKVIQLLIQNFDLIKQSVVNFFKAVANNPITKFLLFPIYLTIAAVKFMIQNFAAIKEVFTNVWNSVSGMLSNMMNWFKAIGKFISVVFQIAYNKIVTNFISPFIQGIKNAFSFVVEKISSFATKLKNFAGILIKPFMPIIEFFQNLGSTIQSSIIDKFKSIGEFVTKIIDKISLFFKSSTSKINAKTEQLITLNTESKSQDVIKNTSDESVKNLEIIKSQEKEISGETIKNKTIETEAIKTKETDKIVNALDKNTNAVNNNSDDSKWSGKFYTSILKDANVNDRMATNEIAKSAIRNEENVINEQKEITNESSKEFITNKLNKSNNDILKETFLESETNKLNDITKDISNVSNVSNQNFKESEIAKSAIRNEENVINNQREVLKENEIVKNVSNISNMDSFSESDIVNQKSITSTNEVVTPNSFNRKNENKKDQITINVVDNTNKKFGIEIESTGVNVVTTGNA